MSSRTMAVSMAVLIAALAPAASHAADCERLYIGTQQQGGAPSLFTAAFHGSDGSFGPVAAVAAIERPTWLVKDPARPVLYAVSETGNDGASHGKVYGLRIGTDTLTETGSVDAGGGGPTHLAFDAPSDTLLVANYGTGHVAALSTRDGALAGPVSVVQDAGTGPTPRQRGPHAHGVTIDPSRHYALVADLGADRIFIYRFDAATRQLAPATTPFVRLAPGTGPRGLVFGPDGRTVYLLAELSGELTVYTWNATSGTLLLLQTLSTQSPGYTGKISAGDLIVSRDGTRLYVSNRGDGTIITYLADAHTQQLAEVQRIASGGAQPWHLVLSGDGRWLLAANAGADMLASFRVNADGKLAPAQQVAVPKPVNIVFAGACPALP